MIHVVLYRERHGFVGTIDRAAGCIHQVLNLVITAALEDVQKAGEIGIRVSVGVLDGVAHTRLGGHVTDALGLVGAKQLFHGLPVGNVLADFRKTAIVPQTIQPGFFQAGIVIVVHVIHANHVIAALKQAKGDVESDKAGGTGDKNFQGSDPVP